MSFSWLDRPTLVTGATGLVGAWLVRRLQSAGAEIVCLVRDWVPQSKLVRGGLIERTKVVRILRLMGSALDPKARNAASNEIMHQYLTAAKARRMLGCSPMFSLEDGLRRTIEWYRGFLINGQSSGLPSRPCLGFGAEVSRRQVRGA